VFTVWPGRAACNRSGKIEFSKLKWLHEMAPAMPVATAMRAEGWQASAAGRFECCDRLLKKDLGLKAIPLQALGLPI
jgi:hypothetical protein